MHPNHLATNLSQIKEQIWTTDLGNTDLEAMKRIAAELVSELEVYEALEKTSEWLRETNKEKDGYNRLCTAHKKRITSIVKEVHGGSLELNDRFEALQRLDTETFMLIASSYTAVTITRMALKTFNRLKEVTPKYISTHSLPPGWILRNEFQVGVAQSAEVGGEFKRKYQEIESAESAKPVCNDENRHKMSRPEPEEGIANLQGTYIATYKEISHTEHVDSEPGMGIQAAFAIPRQLWPEIWEEYGSSWENDLILTIPTEDRVASALHTIPRDEAITIGDRYHLQYLDLPTAG